MKHLFLASSLVFALNTYAQSNSDLGNKVVVKTNHVPRILIRTEDTMFVMDAPLFLEIVLSSKEIWIESPSLIVTRKYEGCKPDTTIIQEYNNTPKCRELIHNPS
jgi:hypothetical protein